jgi:hypothetical protein
MAAGQWGRGAAGALRRSARGQIGGARWAVLLRDRLPAYLSRQEYDAHLARLQANQARAAQLGVVRAGPALRGRVLVWGTCGCHLAGTDTEATSDSSQGRRLPISSGAARCRPLAGPCLDACVRAQVRAALAPAALAGSLAAAAPVEQARTDLACRGQPRLERACEAAARAGRQ